MDTSTMMRSDRNYDDRSASILLISSDLPNEFFGACSFHVEQVSNLEEASRLFESRRYAVAVLGSDIHAGCSGVLQEFFLRYPDMRFVLIRNGNITEEPSVLYSYGYSDVFSADDGHQLNIRRLETMVRSVVLEAENLFLNERFLKAQQELEEYVYVVSHDLKAPLRGLATLASFIEEELGEKSSQSIAELLGMMNSRTERMQLMLDGILHYSRTAIREHPTEIISIKTLIDKALEEISPSENVLLEVPDELPELCVDAVKLKEVFRNLIANGITHNEQPVKRVSIYCKDLGDELEFSIKDNGKGIRADHQEKVFGLFQTLQPKDNTGIGLGLAIVKKIVEQQCGSILVDSTVGCGSTFTFTWKKREVIRTF